MTPFRPSPGKMKLILNRKYKIFFYKFTVDNIVYTYLIEMLLLVCGRNQDFGNKLFT